MYGTWTGAEQDSFLAMIAAVGRCHRRQDQLHRPARPRDALTAGIAGGNLPDVAGLPGPGLMQQWYKKAPSSRSTSSTSPPYESSTPAGFAALGKAPDGKLAGIFTKGAVKGLIWYNTKNWTGAAARRPGMSSTPRPRPRRPATTKEWCIGARVRRRLRLAGHRLDRGHRPAPVRPGRLRQLGRRARKWTRPEIKAAWQTFGEAVANAYGGADVRRTRPTSARPANPMFATRPAACSTTRRASSPTSSRTRRRRQPDRLRLLPVPRHQPAYAGSRDRRRRPVRHVQRHAAGQVADPVPADPRGPGDLGRSAAASSRPTRASGRRLPGRLSKKSATILANAKIFRFDGSDLMPDAMNKAFFKAIVDFVQNPGEARLDPRRTSTACRPSAYSH